MMNAKKLREKFEEFKLFSFERIYVAMSNAINLHESAYDSAQKVRDLFENLDSIGHYIDLFDDEEHEQQSDTNKQCVNDKNNKEIDSVESLLRRMNNWFE